MIIEIVAALGALVVGALGGRLTRPRPALPPAEKQCACPTDDDGLMRCEGIADPRCAGGSCPVHCAKFCKGACSQQLPGPDDQLEQCSSPAYKTATIRCEGVEDPRCRGRNCTAHCKEHCGGACLRGLRAVS